MSKSTIEQTDTCLNCHHPLEKAHVYCPNCGQKNLSDHLTFSYFFQDFLVNVFSIDSKLFKTFKSLLLRPAFLSLEFIQGRRIRYVNPIQLFMFASFSYFLINSFMFLKEENDNFQFTGVDGSKGSVYIQPGDSTLVLDELSELDSITDSYSGMLLKKAQAFNSLDKESQNDKISRNISYTVFLLLPIFAFYLGLIFKSRRKKYLENIVFSLHFHSFYFILGTFFLLIDKLVFKDIDILLHYVLVILYLVIALKKFYEFSWGKTLLRCFFILSIYGLTVSIFLIATILLSVFI